ncbi:MAG TPA: ThuA domain-containing protein [Spirochaetia bacterium]|nr:ThuA domain-containing protein [Spirochaetia bacterium]
MAPQKIVALVGDYYHRPEGMAEALGRLSDSLDVGLDVFTDTGALPWGSLAGYRALIMAKENRVAPAESDAVWATPAHESAIAEYAAAGGAVVALHNGLASFGETGAYFATVRGSFQFHPREHPRFAVRAMAADHPAAAGFQPFDLTDEMYFVHVEASRTTRLLEVVHPDYGSSCAAWAHETGRGRVFCFTPGHTVEVLGSPGYRATLETGLRWALRLG